MTLPPAMDGDVLVLDSERENPQNKKKQKHNDTSKKGLLGTKRRFI